jgi:hypothetical protein
LFTALIGVLLLWFWGYQMRMVLLNMTSNDLNKVDDVLDELHSKRNAEAVHELASDIAGKIFRWTGRNINIPPPPPPPPPQDGGEAVRPAKVERVYRESVDKVLRKALVKTFSAGSWAKNLAEVYFPYSGSSAYQRTWMRSGGDGLQNYHNKRRQPAHSPK